MQDLTDGDFEILLMPPKSALHTLGAISIDVKSNNTYLQLDIGLSKMYLAVLYLQLKVNILQPTVKTVFCNIFCYQIAKHPINTTQKKKKKQ